MKRQKNATRIIAIVLVALMALALVPIAASAEAGPLVLNANYAGATPGTKTPDVTRGQDYVLTAADEPTREHFGFKYWSTSAADEEGSKHYSTNDGVNIPAEPTVLALFAQWDEDAKYTVSFDANYEGAPTVTPVTNYADENVYPDMTLTREGYRLAGWSETSTGAAAYDTVTPYVITTADNQTLYAVWVETVTVNYDTNGGSASIASQTKDAGESFGLPSPGDKEGCSFKYWQDGTKPLTGDSFIPTASTTVVAQWEKSKIAVSYNGGDATGGSAPTNPAAGTYEYGDGFILPECSYTYTGKSFSGWSVNSAKTQQPGEQLDWSKAESNSITLTALWENSITVTFNANGGTPNPPAKVLPENGSLTSLPEVTRTGYDWLGWYNGDELVTATKASPYYPHTNKNLQAHWRSLNVTFHFLENGGTGTMADQSAARSTGKYTLPTTCSFTAPDNCIFGNKWRIGSSEYEAGSDYAIDANTPEKVEVSPIWAAKVTVTFDAKGGVASFSTKDIPQGNAIGTLPTASKTDGSSFGGWYLEESYATKVETTTTFDASTTVYAKWTADEVYVGFNGSSITAYPMSRTSARMLLPYSVLKSEIPAPEGKIFGGWNRESGKTEVQFTDMQSVKWDGSTEALTVEGDSLSLYPVWLDKITGTVTIKRGTEDVTTKEVKVGDALTASTDSTSTPLYYRWVRGTGDDLVVLGSGNTYTPVANDAQSGQPVRCEVSTDQTFSYSINNYVTVASDDQVVLTVKVSGAASGSKVTVSGQDFTADGTKNVVKNADVTVSVTVAKGQELSAVKKDGESLSPATSYTWKFENAATVEFTFADASGTTKTAAIDPSKKIDTVVKNKFLEKAGSTNRYDVFEVVACWDNDVTKLLPDGQVPSEGLPFTLPYPEGSNFNDKVAKWMNAYYLVQAYHWDGSKLVEVAAANLEKYPNYSGSNSGVLVKGQTDFSPYGLVLTPTNLEGSITFSGLKDGGKAAVGSPVTATFTSTKTVDGKNVPVAGTLSYQWQYKDGSDWKNISGATSSSYTPTAAYRGSNLRVVVTSSFETGSVESGDFTVTEKPNPTLNKYIINDGSEQTGVIGNVTSDMQYILSSSTPGTTGWSNVSGTTIPNLTESGRYWVRFKNDSNTSNWAYVEMPAYYTVTARPDSVSGNRLSFDATGDAIKYKNDVWLVSSGKSIAVNAYSTDTRYYKLTKLTSQMSYSPYTTSSKTFSNANSGSITVSVKASPYVVYGSAGVYGSKTGDSSHLELWMELACISLMGLCAAVVLGRKKLKKQ